MKKGITFMALVIMIAIILTLTTTAVISGVNAVNNTKKIKFATELSYVQEIVNSYIDVKYNINFDKTYVIDITEASQDVKFQFNNEIITNGKVSLYEIDQNLEVFKNSDLTYGKKQIGNNEQEKQEDIFLYSIDTGRIYYARGLELNGKLYYTLTDELKEKIDYSEISVSNANSGNIIFTKSIEEWTNLSVTCEIKIPKIYNKDTIRVYKNGIEITESNETTSQYIYQINTDQNCNILVEYVSTDGKQVSKNYDVTNIDKIVPTLEVTDINKIINSEDGNLSKSLQIIQKYDNQSGIKYIKYEKTKVPLDNIKSYFLNNGILLEGDSITIPNDVENITLYIEDNAGNYYSMIK